MSSGNQGTNFSLKDYKAVLRLWIFMERKRQTWPDLDIIELPDWLPRWNGSRCDAALGPCSCGAWHHEEELR